MNISASIALTLLCLLAHGQSARADAIPAAARNCAIAAPPADSGAYVTPGGFLIVHPRNAALSADYTGCKSIWLADETAGTPLLLRLYFEQGKLLALRNHRAAAPNECVRPFDSPACRDADANPLTTLYLATWPLACMEGSRRTDCSGDPD
ncbi:hypothetical protein NP590_01195 [Methylomonas sp. SURF-2]|uniref:Secreted protein n=1 Tax=Methylomonas subterranea TaxID=2952225 RepID=A0ABT1TB68_9GAMM|nr:hypothetical protein [Methylomonas sp. SURF-2]MCQ8102704.1 hypothetical protein [Methylomonas sp. SURF-2]